MTPTVHAVAANMHPFHRTTEIKDKNTKKKHTIKSQKLYKSKSESIQTNFPFGDYQYLSYSHFKIIQMKT